MKVEVEKMVVKTLNREMIEREIGYRPFTTFYEDFSIAEFFGESAILDTYDRAMEEWKNEYRYLTELSMVLNWKMWYFYDKNEDSTELYKNLWIACDTYCRENLKDDELIYYYRTTD